MQAVGRLGSYISKSVHTVSGPFHPFGGAVDIIVVEQPDGSYKSSPWYVRFGKFQGVLKTKERVVSISVNGVEADFHMHLDHKGEAYFLKEVDVEEGDSVCSPPSSSGEDTDRQSENRWPLKSKGCNYDANWSDSNVNERNRNAVARTNSRRSQLLGLVFGKGTIKEDGNLEEEEASGVIRTDSLERAEIAADLLELKWSTNLASSRHRKDNASQFSVEYVSKDDADENLQVDGCTDDEPGLLSHSSHQELESTVDENGIEMKCLTPENVAETVTSIAEDTFLTEELGLAKADYQANSVTMISDIAKSNSQIQDSDEKLNSLSDPSFSKEENATDSIQAIYDSETSESSGVELEGSIEQASVSFCNGEFGQVSVYTETVHNMTQSISEVKSEPERDVLHGQEPLNIQECFGKGDQFTIIHEEKITMSGGTLYVTSESIVTDSYSQMSNCDCVASYIPSSRISEEEKLLFGNLDDFASNDAKHLKFTQADHEEKEANSSFSRRVAYDVNQSCHPKCCSSFVLDQSVRNDTNLQGRRLRTISSDVCINTTGHAQSQELAKMVRSLPSKWPLSNNLEPRDLGHSFNPSLHSGVKSGANDNRQSPGAPSMAEVKILKENEEGPAEPFIGNPPRSNDSLRGSRRSWPFSFKRLRSMEVSHPALDGSENSNVTKILKNTGDLEGDKDVTKVKVNKKKVSTLTPTTEQLKSLSLKEGRNVVIFTFSTAMLRKQQVDARIFLLRWDTQIVISDVDGTITRSDLLGQVMPLVGMDWSQIGVAHLFSAIKENGYQLLFLSARSISQAFHTRQFLFNIKQDGKALPDGPVVISPDGLFPSLFREVIRRAPHEFKISCLEDIKALFPADKNPFYAGFGNRDTDEFSYLKVGIPRGKIFIINPKGEIAVNRLVDTKSYLSLHTLVHGMFPSMSSCEQEDFNSWNYWKLPPPIIDV